MAEYLIPTTKGAKTDSPVFREDAMRAFLEPLSSAAGLTVTRDARTIPYGREDLSDLFTLIGTLQKVGIAKKVARAFTYPDEPRAREWTVSYGEHSRKLAGGMALNDRDALTAAIAESVERHVWMEETDFLRGEHRAAVRSLSPSRYILPDRFAGYIDAQRCGHQPPSLNPDSEITWVRGYSWTRRGRTYVPAQIVSGVHGRRATRNKDEPIIREAITTGLATAPSAQEAVLRGALEVIERDAFMIMWLNQLSLPRIPLSTLADMNPQLDIQLKKCEQYGLTVEFVRLITDAPAYVICAVVSDAQHMPPITIGLSAHKTASYAAQKALFEALRARRNARFEAGKRKGPLTKKKNDIVHMDRSLYWYNAERSQKLSFLISGALSDSQLSEPWNNDDRSHLTRILEWCTISNYECTSVALTHAKKNRTSWHIQFVVIPELQPMHQDERHPPLYGKRLEDIPRQFGYEPRSEVYTDEPHPFV